jgi:hypothetical protein
MNGVEPVVVIEGPLECACSGGVTVSSCGARVSRAVRHHARARTCERAALAHLLRGRGRQVLVGHAEERALGGRALGVCERDVERPAVVVRDAVPPADGAAARTGQPRVRCMRTESTDLRWRASRQRTRTGQSSRAPAQARYASTAAAAISQLRADDGGTCTLGGARPPRMSSSAWVPIAMANGTMDGGGGAEREEAKEQDASMMRRSTTRAGACRRLFTLSLSFTSINNFFFQRRRVVS